MIVVHIHPVDAPSYYVEVSPQMVEALEKAVTYPNALLSDSLDGRLLFDILEIRNEQQGHLGPPSFHE